jgi:hypothetical protein
VELDFAAFAASAGIAAPTSGTRTAKANRDFKSQHVGLLVQGIKDDQATHYVDAGHLSGVFGPVRLLLIEHAPKV